MAIRLRKPHLARIERLRNPEGNRIRQVRLDKNERTVPFSSDAWRDMIDSFDPELLTVYPEMGGLIARIAESIGLTPAHVYLTAGSDLAIKSCFEAFVTPSSEVAYVAPTFAMVDVYGRLFEAVMRPTPTVGDDLHVDVDVLIDSIGEATSLVFIANPNSPAGTVMARQELERVIAKCEQLGCPILVDEAYFYFCRETVMDLIPRYSCLMVCRTLSKAMGLAGVRVGFLAGQPSIVDLVGKWRPMYEINGLAVHFGSYVLDHPDLVEEYVSRVDAAKALVYEWGDARGLRVHRSGANFLNIRVGRAHVVPIVEACALNNMIVRGAGPAVLDNDCIRISLGTPEQARNVLDVIDRVMHTAGESVVMKGAS